MLKLQSDVARRGYHIYKKLEKSLVHEHAGEYVAIDIHSGHYFIGKDMSTALDKAEQSYPDEKFFVVRVGDLVTASFKHRFSL